MQHILRKSFGSVAREAFPMTLDQLQLMVKTCLTSEGGLVSDTSHLSVSDKAYLERRNSITSISASYNLVASSEIPTIEYTPMERKIWHSLFDDLSEA